MADIEIRPPTVSSYVVAVLQHEVLDVAGVIVDGLGPLVRSIELQSVAEPFINLEPKAVVAGIAVALIDADVGQRQPGSMGLLGESAA